MTDPNIRNLACAITMQVIRDYFDCPKQRHQILRDLRSSYMDMLTDGLSVMTADQLERNPEAIRARIRKMKE